MAGASYTLYILFEERSAMHHASIYDLTLLPTRGNRWTTFLS